MRKSSRAASSLADRDGQLEIPDTSNFHSSLYTSLSREEVARLYGELEWSIRKCSWTVYDVACSWAELVIEGESPILMHGPVGDVLAHVEELVAPLRASGIRFTAECYGPEPEAKLILNLQF
jgi:hypothetical protein